jgi:hypothetical protein
MGENLPEGTKVALVSVASSSAQVSEYVISRLEAALVSGKKLVVVDRANLDKVREEQGFQLSGEVDDNSAKSIGKLLGAGAIVTGAFTDLGDVYSLTLKAINIETATVAVSYPADITKSTRIETLLARGGAETGPSASPRPPAQTAQTPVPAQPALSQPAASGDQPRPGLYAGNEYQGLPDIYDALDWLALNARSDGNYTFVLERDQAITPTELDYGGKQVSLTLKAQGGNRTISFEVPNPAYSLFTIKSGVTLTLEDGVTLFGAQNDKDKSIVRVAGGRFIMNGGTITGNTSRGNGGGVYVESRGTFTMHNGTINGNTASGNSGGGGVYVASGTFTMNNGAISGNTASGDYSNGGGVYVTPSGTFTMTGGIISGNTSRRDGGGVYGQMCKFTKSGGIIYGSNATEDGQANRAGSDGRGHAVYISRDSGKKRNTTARAAIAMDSYKNGLAGGWE